MLPPAALNLCLHVHTWDGMSASAVENYIFGYTPFQAVIQISALAQIIHPENTEGVNQSPVMEPKGSKGRSGVLQC